MTNAMIKQAASDLAVLAVEARGTEKVAINFADAGHYVSDTAKNLYNGISDDNKKTIGMGLGGAALGGTLGALSSKKKEDGSSNWLRNAAMGAVAGGAVGAGGHLAYRSTQAAPPPPKQTPDASSFYEKPLNPNDMNLGQKLMAAQAVGRAKVIRGVGEIGRDLNNDFLTNSAIPGRDVGNPSGVAQWSYKPDAQAPELSLGQGGGLFMGTLGGAAGQKMYDTLRTIPRDHAGNITQPDWIRNSLDKLDKKQTFSLGGETPQESPSRFAPLKKLWQTATDPSGLRDTPAPNHQDALKLMFGEHAANPDISVESLQRMPDDQLRPAFEHLRNVGGNNKHEIDKAMTSTYDRFTESGRGRPRTGMLFNGVENFGDNKLSTGSRFGRFLRRQPFLGVGELLGAAGGAAADAYVGNSDGQKQRIESVQKELTNFAKSHPGERMSDTYRHELMKMLNDQDYFDSLKN